MNDAKRFAFSVYIFIFPLSAKLDYRFVRSFASDPFILCSSRLWQNNISYLYHATPSTKRPNTNWYPYLDCSIHSLHALQLLLCCIHTSNSNATVCVRSIFVVELSSLLLLNLFIYILFASIVLMIITADAKEKPKQHKYRRENENKNNNLISFHDTFFCIVHLLLCTRNALALYYSMHVYLYGVMCRAFSFYVYCCSLRFCILFSSFFLLFLNWILLNRFVCLEDALTVWNGATFAEHLQSTEKSAHCTLIHHLYHHH